MPNREDLTGIRFINNKIQVLRAGLDELATYVNALQNAGRLPAVGAVYDRAPGARVSTGLPAKGIPPKATGEKRCQACKQLRPVSDFEMGAERPRRRCIHCDADVKPNSNIARSSSPATPQNRNPAFVYSKPVRCPKCHAPSTRMERRAEATVSDNWTCLANHCELRIGNYTMPIDRNFSGGTAV